MTALRFWLNTKIILKPFQKGRSGKVMIRKIDQQAQSYCSSVFVEPIAWMTEILEGNRMGSLLCPKCKQKVGHFDWAGLQVRFIKLNYIVRC